MTVSWRAGFFCVPGAASSASATHGKRWLLAHRGNERAGLPLLLLSLLRLARLGVSCCPLHEMPEAAAKVTAEHGSW